jgi:hypothetical protein
LAAVRQLFVAMELTRNLQMVFVKIITAGVSRIYRSLALSSSSLAESYAKALEYNGVAGWHVRFWRIADIARLSSNVRFWG